MFVIIKVQQTLKNRQFKKDLNIHIPIFADSRFKFHLPQMVFE